MVAKIYANIKIEKRMMKLTNPLKKNNDMINENIIQTTAKIVAFFLDILPLTSGRANSSFESLSTLMSTRSLMTNP